MKHHAFLYLTLLITTLSMIPMDTRAQSGQKFTSKVTFKTIGSMQNLQLLALMPIPYSNEYQTITDVRISDGQIYDANNSNKVLYFCQEDFSESNFTLMESCLYTPHRVKIDFRNCKSPNFIEGTDPNKYLGSEGEYIDLSNETLQAIGDKLWGWADNDTIKYARLCYEYVAKNCNYINGNIRTLAEIIRIGGGECGDFSTVFISLMRYKGIPARHNIGLWKNKSVNGKLHVFPDFYMKQYGWIPVDPTFKHNDPQGDYFGRYDGGLVIVSQGLTNFKKGKCNLKDGFLQSYYYWYWYRGGNGSFNVTHDTSQKYEVADKTSNDK